MFYATIGLGQTNPELILQLDSIKQEDQKWRNLFTEFENNQTDTLGRDRIIELIKQTDSLNYIKVKNIFLKEGFLGYDKVGKEGSHKFWLIVQHQDNYPAFQTMVLAKMKEDVDRNNASSKDYAYFVDRVKVNTGQLQIYGTQMQLNADSSSYEPKPVIEPEKLNERRKAVGLSPIENYIRTMNERYFGTLTRTLQAQDPLPPFHVNQLYDFKQPAACILPKA